MIISVAAEYGVSLNQAAAVSLLSTFSATMAGRFASQVLLGWMPGLGNAINAATAATITELVGWVANEYFSSGKSPQ